MEKRLEPLVSVAVIAYRASDFIIETLESVKAQTYQNIELIVSDDASPDDTVEKCSKWIDENRSRFADIKLITVEQNTGVAGNCSRALAASSGYYYKGMGCDDILVPDCVEKFVFFFQNNPSIKFSFAKEIRFTDDFSDHHFEYCKFPFRALCFRDKVTAKQQLKTLSKTFIGVAPTMFVETDVLRAEGGIDDTYSTEDGPLFIRLTSAGVKLCFMDEFVIYRRIHNQSLTHQKNDDALLKSIYTPKKKRWVDLQYEYASPFWKAAHRYSKWLIKKELEAGNSRESFKCRFYDFLRRWINPFKWDLIWMNTKEWMLNKLGY